MGQPKTKFNKQIREYSIRCSKNSNCGGGGGRLTSHDSLYQETKWKKPEDSRNNHTVVLFHKMNTFCIIKHHNI